jgi:hypothetical protein
VAIPEQLASTKNGIARVNAATNDAEHNALQGLKRLQAEFGEGIID